MAKTFDTEYLIKLVEDRPVIWDKTLITYRDRNLRAAAWHDICINLKEDFEDMEEKERQAFVKGVVNKWNQTRDSWLRSSMKESVSTAKFVKRYVYHNQMLFLKKVVNPALIRESIKEVYLRTFDDTEKDKVKEEVDNETFSNNQNEEIVSDSDTQENFDVCIQNKRRKSCKIMAPHTGSATPEQIDALLNFLDEHRDLARGRLRSLEGKVQAKRLWDELCNMLNSMGGCTKKFSSGKRYGLIENIWPKKPLLIPGGRLQ
ncbi:unnamed protein product [Parnassius apollo]|uniref:(apollo) hypothetical protein n=1 Tax=Parnassius apollo TaxID=110799 RepID=A0A8S3Y3X9_PARAO|nr:unnamed protein product [Parnassius apollo]